MEQTKIHGSHILLLKYQENRQKTNGANQLVMKSIELKIKFN